MKTYARERSTKASPARVWAIWSDVSTWKAWNPNVASMSIDGPFQTGAHLVMNTRAGRGHQMVLRDVQAARGFDLETRVIPGTTFMFVCRIRPEGAGSAISQGLQIGGPLGPVVGPMTGERIAATFGELLDGLAAAAEGT